MRIFLGTTAAVLFTAVEVSGFVPSSWTFKTTTALKMSSSYDEQLKLYYNSQQLQVEGETNTNTEVNLSDPTTNEKYPLLNINPYMNAQKEQATAAVSALSQETQTTATCTQVAIQGTDEVNNIPGAKDVNRLIATGVAFLGLPIWLLLSVQVFGNLSGAPSTVPANVATVRLPSNVANLPATPSGVVVLSQPITKAEVRALFNLWNDALKTGDPEIVAQRYGRNGVLLPTLSDIPRNDFEGIKDYFVGFLRKKPVGKILEGDVYVGNNWAQDAGIYEFSFEDGSKVKARYSFVYAFEDGKWMISHHHSSLMPQEVVRPTPITDVEVRGLFDLWNAALATGDPQQVAARYSEDAVLLPTLSDSARYTKDGIADYFVGFLQKKPVGKILEGNVKTGANWAQDAGIYEFSFEDGSKVQGRYSFVYTYENGEWKISNHHSSIMPEGAVAAIKKVAEMEKAVEVA